MLKKIFTCYLIVNYFWNLCNVGKAVAMKRISEIRERAFDSCLKCEGNSCKMLLYPPESDPAKFCKRVFCTPKKIRKIQGEEIPTDLTIGKSKFEFSYKITEKGRVRDVKIISLEGVMNQRDAYRWTTGLPKG